MRSVIYGVLITVFLASAGAAREIKFPEHPSKPLDGKAVLCTANNKASTYPVYGLMFNQGKVMRWQVNGYFKNLAYFKKESDVRFDSAATNATATGSRTSLGV
jgi:hypothetical protein